MLGPDTSGSLVFTGAGLAQASAPLAPVVLIVLSVVAAVGTVLLLPSRREASLRKIGAVVVLAAGLIFAAILMRWTSRSVAGGMGVYFWLFSTIGLVGAFRVVTHTKPVYSALYFVLTVFATAGMFVLLWAEFMAAALVLIYAGAILITYLFVIMLAAETTHGAKRALAGLGEQDTVSREPAVACTVGFGFLAIVLFVILDQSEPVVRTGAHQPRAVSAAANNTRELGEFLFTKHLVNLELAGLILTVAMIGAIVLARRRVSPHPRGMTAAPEAQLPVDVVLGPATPVDDDPHSIPVVGTLNPRQKEYPET